MRRILLFLTFTATTLCVSAQKSLDIDNNADEVIHYWDNSTAPHSNEESEAEQLNAKGHFTHISETVFYLFKADKAKATGRAVAIFPGGGYLKVCIRNEGFGLAEWFKSQGITAMVVKYRVANNGHKEVPLEDAQAALKYLRERASELGIDPSKVGVCGSSADTLRHTSPPSPSRRTSRHLPYSSIPPRRAEHGRPPKTPSPVCWARSAHLPSRSTIRSKTV